MCVVVLTMPPRVGLLVHAQGGEPQRASVETARAQLAEAVRLEKETPTKEAALAVDDALQRYNAAAQPARSSPTQPPGDEPGTNTTVYPVLLFESEPNNTPGTANALPSSVLTEQHYLTLLGSISPAGDLDLFSFTAPAGSRVWILTDTGGPQHASATSRDTVIDLLAADGTTSLEFDDDDGVGNGGDGTIETGFSSTIAGRTLVAGGTYYVRIKGFSATGVINPYRLVIALTTVTATAEVEGNDSALSANLLVPVGSSIAIRTGQIQSAGDADYYAVAASAGSLLFFGADADPDRDGTGTDVVVELRSPADVLLLSADSSDTGSPTDPAGEGTSFNITADGVYFIRVRPFEATDIGSYHLMVAVSVPTETEPNNTVFTADPLAVLARRLDITKGAIGSAGDVDFYFFTVASGSRVWLALDTGGTQTGGATSRDTVVDLLAPDGITVLETDDNDGTGNGGDATTETGFASIIGGRTLTADGMYYIRVRAAAGGAIISPYRLFVTLTSAAPTSEIESNGTAASATPIVTAGSPIGLRSAEISAGGDWDYYSLVAKAGNVIYFNADGDPERDGLGTDLVVELRSPADALLIEVDSALGIGSLADPAAEGANFTVTSDGTYYLKVRHYSPTNQGTYHLMATVATGQAKPSFTDSPLSTGLTVIRAVHFTELRSRIDALRVRFDLAPFAWTHQSLAGAVVETEDVTELRAAVQAAYAAAGLPAPSYTDPALVPQSTPIRAVHIEELRTAVTTLEGS